MGNSESSSARRSSGASGPPRPGSFTSSLSGPSIRFADIYYNLPSLQADIRRAGLESSNLIVGIDFTKSNEWTGKYSFNGRCLHDTTSGGPNPYESSIMIIGQTLESFDDDNLIPCYGFGSSATHDKDLFSLLPHDEPCHGFTEVLDAYRSVVPSVKLAGPTSFAPLIYKAMSIVQNSGNQYHILLIICDGQVTRSSDLTPSELSNQERETAQAIIDASNYPLSIVCVGVGDGEDEWKRMKEFDDLLEGRRFDNFQFVPLNETLEKARKAVGDGAPDLKATMEATFALHALMEVPQQYRAINALGLLSARTPPPRNVPRVLDPPSAGSVAAASSRRLIPTASFSDAMHPAPAYVPSVPSTAVWQCPRCTLVQQHNPAQPACMACAYNPSGAPVPASVHTPVMGPAVPKVPASAPVAAPVAAPAPRADASELAALKEERTCPVCLDKPKDTVFQCGHQTCGGCSAKLDACPICRQKITTKIRLYN